MPSVVRQGDTVQVYVSGAWLPERSELRHALSGASRVIHERLPGSPVSEATPVSGAFSFVARERGPHVVRLTAGDSVKEIPLRVVSRVLRVLYVEHPPRYEYRFLKNALLRDPDILCHCFLTSADEGFPQEHTRSSGDPLFNQPLQEFPRDLKSLLEFDVLIFGDVDPGRLGPEAARNIRTFVTEFGGGILFISGMMNNPRCFKGGAMADLLPIVPGAPQGDSEGAASMLTYRLTDAGRASTVLRFGEGADARKPWESGELPAARWLHRVGSVKPGARVLVEAAGGSVGPLFVAWECGRGRAFWSATDETWLWRYLVGDSPYFYPFWRGAIEWAAGLKG